MTAALYAADLRHLHELECLAAEKRHEGDDEHAAWLEQDAEDLEARLEAK